MGDIFLRYMIALIVYGVLVTVLLMLRRVSKDVAEIKRSMADIEHTLMLLGPKEPVPAAVSLSELER